MGLDVDPRKIYWAICVVAVLVTVPRNLFKKIPKIRTFVETTGLKGNQLESKP